MDRVKNIYIESRYKPFDSVSNSGFKHEINESIDIAENTICYIDEMSIPHTWYTIEDYNDQVYIETTNSDLTLSVSIITTPMGNYTASGLATALSSSLQTRFPEYGFSCGYNHNVGTINITNSIDSSFRIMTNAFAVSLQGSILGWYGNMGEEIGQPNYNNLRSIDEVLRNSIHLDAESFYESGFIDLLNVHNMYTHSPNLGHDNSIGVRGENTIIKQVPVPSGFGYLCLDSVVAPNDNIDVSRQLTKTVQFSFKKCPWKCHRFTWGPCELEFDICHHGLFNNLKI